jgi:hypothetical protein
VSAPPDERRRAAELLWSRAQDLDIWIDQRTLSGARSDAQVVASLIEAGGLEELKGRVKDAVTGGSRFQRGNAIDVLAEARFDDAERLLRRVIVDDDDEVVRRGAASAARQLDLAALLGPLETRALRATDNAEAGDLASVALELTPASEKLSLAIRLTRGRRDEVHDWTLLDRLPEADQLPWLVIQSKNGGEPDPLTADRITRIAGEKRRASAHQATQIAFVAAAARANSAAVVDFVRRRPHSATGLIDALDGHLVESFEIIDLLLAVGSRALERHGAAAGVLDDVRAWEQAARGRVRHAPPAPRARPAPLQPPQLEAILRIQDRDERLRELLRGGDQLTSQPGDAPAPVKARLAEELSELWGERDLRSGVDVLEDKATITAWAHAILQAGPPLKLELSAARWVQVALCEWLYPPQTGWLLEQTEPARVALALDASPSARSLADLIQLSAASDLAAVVAAILALDPGRLPRHKIEAVAATLARHERPDLLAELAAHDPAVAPVAEPFLAISGDEDAQRKLLEQLNARMQAGERVNRHDVEWLTAVRERSLFEPLRIAIGIAGAKPSADESPFGNPLVALQEAAERVDPEASITLYQQQIEHPPWFGAQFVVHRQEALVQRLISDAGRSAAREAAARLDLPSIA